MKTTKLSDIAKQAGVSLATVGRVIHQNGYVAADKRQLIEAIIAETGYVPNKIAQGLKSSRSKLIGHMTLYNPNLLFEQISTELNRAANRRGYQVLTLTSHRGQDEETYQVDELISQHVDGVMITSNPFISRDHIAKFAKAKIPVVLIERIQDLPHVDGIAVDDFQGSYDAVSQMLQNGHRRIGFVGMQGWHEVEQRRLAGYNQALAAFSLEPDPSLIYFAQDYQIGEGLSAAAQLLSQPDRPTALFLTSDIFACGVMQYCYAQDIRLPRDLALIGYDNTLASLLAPPISSMALPTAEIGEQAMDLLCQRLADFDRPHQTLSVRPFLIDRQTVRLQP